MRKSSIVYCLAAVLLASSCSGDKARIVVSMPDSPEKNLIVSQLDVNRNAVLDTLQCDESGRAVIKVDVTGEDPDFFYISTEEAKIASLVLKAGDKVEVTVGKDGGVRVSGSEDSKLMMSADSMYAAVTERMDVLSDRLVANYSDIAKSDELRREMGKTFVDYYKQSVAFVMSNPSSLASVSVLFQTIGDNLKVFATDTDVAHFRNVRDAIAGKYPSSRYLKSLDSEIKSRENALQMRIMLENAGQVGYPDLILPDTKSEKVQLSSLKSKVVVLHFWSAADAVQKMYNQDVLKPLYEKYSDKGLEIYQVSFDRDKAMWAGVVKDQELKWINVNDYVGTSATYYALSQVPYTYVIVDGAIAEKGVYSYEYLDALVKKSLK